MSESIWEKDVFIPERNKLEDNIKTDVCIIGAGLAGILTGYMLQKSGLNTVILEADRIGSGQTKGTTAKITSQHGMIYSSLYRNFGRAGVWQYANANEEAIATYEKIIQEEHIPCDFHRCASYLYTTKSTELLENEAEAARMGGIAAELTQKTELPMDILMALKFPNQAAFHPLKFIKVLSETLNIYENSKVLKVTGRKAETETGRVWAKHIVFACHFPFINIPGYYFMKMYQERSYVLALKNAPIFENYYYGIDKDGLSFRSDGENLLISGGNHRTGARLSDSPYKLHTKIAGTFWPDCYTTAHWSAQDCMTADHIPYIGRFSKKTPNWYVATGFGKWGMTSSMVSAKILTDLICGQAEIQRDIFYPRREVSPSAMSGYLKNSLHILMDFSKYLLPNRWVNKPGDISHVHDICPHMGCPLTWNPEEETYECPCHGSRFDSEGRLLAGPAQKNLKEQ